jgi:hypothetical protein
MDEITIAADLACDTATEVSGTVECLFNGFHAEVGVASVNHFEESNLGVAG